VSEQLGEQLAAAREHIDTDFGPRDVERGLTLLQGRIRRRRNAGYAGSAAGMLACSLAAWLLLFDARPPAPQGSALLTRDGSVATPIASQTQLRVVHDRDDEVSLELARGSGHFEVTRNPKRRYRVRAGNVEVEVLGTAFEVAKRAAHSTVRVERGLVRVRWPGGSTLLHAGESGAFPPLPVSSPPQPSAAAEPAADVSAGPNPLGGLAASAEPDLAQDLAETQLEAAVDDLLAREPAGLDGARNRARSRERWRTLARAGKHREAFGSLQARPVQDLAGLLLAADAARHSGHPREAADYLQRLLRRYPHSVPARLAAFTLGRLALHELGEPALAASSFARAYALDPHGPLAEDALSRTAEAHRRAGAVKRARDAASRYIERFPHGARREEMSSYLAL
jgi:TolA-binding protein